MTDSFIGMGKSKRDQSTCCSNSSVVGGEAVSSFESVEISSESMVIFDGVVSLVTAESALIGVSVFVCSVGLDVGSDAGSE